MTRPIFILFLFFLNNIYGQNQLFFVKENDSMLSVRNSKEVMIIPAFIVHWEVDYSKRLIDTDILIIAKQFINYEVYDRQGNFLFYPKIFDFGVVFSEGHLGFRKDGKYGLADKEGTITIPPIYDEIGFLNHGYIEACNGCFYDKSRDEEHPPLVGGVWYLLDKKGEILQEGDSRDRISPAPMYSFQYNKEEREILLAFNKYKHRIAGKLKLAISDIVFEIVYGPTKFEPSYHIKLYRKINNAFISNFDDSITDNFYFDPQKKQFYAYYEAVTTYKKNKEVVVEIKKKKQNLDRWLNNKNVTP